MGILDNIISRSPFLSQTQGMFNPQAQMGQPQMPAAPQQPGMDGMFSIPAPPAPQPKQKQGGGIDPSLIMKIMSMFGGA